MHLAVAEEAHFGAVGITRIVHGGGMKMAIAGEDRKTLQGGPGREGIGEGAAHVGAEGGIGFAAKAQTARTGEGVEKGTARGSIFPFRGNGLQEGAAVGLVVDDAGNADAQPCVIGELRAATGGGAGVRQIG